MRVAVSLIAVFYLAVPLSAVSQDSTDLDALTQAEAEARETEAQLKSQRETILKEIAALKAELARDTQQTQAYERERQRISDRLATIETELLSLEAELDRNRSETQSLLASLQRLQLSPNTLTLADPDDAVRTAQAATMIELLTAALQQKAEAARIVAENTANVRNQAIAERAELEANATELEKRKVRTERLVAEKDRLQQSIQSEADKARQEAMRFAGEAESLRELLERVTAIPDKVAPRLKPEQNPFNAPVQLPPGTTRFAEAKGGMVRPVSGRMSEGFGRNSKGQTYSARSGGQVIAPYAGRVEFVGPFSNYGQVVILNMNDGYYLLLTGMGDTYVSTNETVRRGEPVGSMPGASGRTPLYIELRRNGLSIDPEPWMGGRS